jgi:hypothetical protein
LSNFSWAISSLRRCLSSDMSSSCVVARFGDDMILSCSKLFGLQCSGVDAPLLPLFACGKSVTLRHGFGLW